MPRGHSARNIWSCCGRMISNTTSDIFLRMFKLLGIDIARNPLVDCNPPMDRRPDGLRAEHRKRPMPPMTGRPNGLPAHRHAYPCMPAITLHCNSPLGLLSLVAPSNTDTQ